MEDSTAMTIEFLRARLLAERSVSRTTKQRADELAIRVIELEKELKFVSAQRKKAEKATADVLNILKNHGRSDASESFDSSSEEDEISSDFKGGEASENVKAQEGFSGSDDESSSVNSRSLSWKSSKDSSSRPLKKKYTDASSRIRNSFTSSGSSPRRVGKSCRQIRRREHRSAVNGPENDATTNAHCEDEVGTSSEGVLNSTNITIDNLREDSGNHEEKILPEISTSSGILENHDITDDHNMNNHGSEIDMEGALEHQAQLIGRYEAQEKAQMEWEDKFRENDSPQDSCDPGTHSDVTEERNEIKAPPPPQSTNVHTTKTQENDVGAGDAIFNEEPKTSSGFEPSSSIQDQKINDMNDEKSKSNNPPVKSFSFNPSHVSSSGKINELDRITPHENPDNLGSVLEALQQAKLSLKQNLERFPLLESGPPTVSAYKSVEKFAVPFSSSGLFRLPTDYQYGGVTTTNSSSYDSSSRLSLTNYPIEPTSGQTFSSPSRSITATDDRFLMVPTFPYQEITSGTLFQQPPVFVPRLGVGPSVIDQRLGVGSPGYDPRLGVGQSGYDPRLGVSPSGSDPRLVLGPSGSDPRLVAGPSGSDPRLGAGLSGIDSRLDVGPSRFDPRLGAGPSGVDTRLDVGPSFSSNRYARSLDHPGAGLPSSSTYNDGRNPSLHPGRDYTSHMYR